MLFKFCGYRSVHSLSLKAPTRDLRGLLLALGEDGRGTCPLTSLSTLQVSIISNNDVDGEGEDKDKSKEETERIQEALLSVLEPRLTCPQRNRASKPLKELILSRILVGKNEDWYRKRVPQFTFMEDVEGWIARELLLVAA